MYRLAKMAKQYLAAPFSSAGVERVFSAAGKMHDDLRKAEKDSTLEASLFAAINVEWCLPGARKLPCDDLRSREMTVAQKATRRGRQRARHGMQTY